MITQLIFGRFSPDEDAVADLEDLYSIAKAVQEFRAMESSASSVVTALGFAEVDNIDGLLTFFKSAVSLEELLGRVETTYLGARADLSLVRNLSTSDVASLSAFLQRYATLRKPLIGYLFSRRALDALDHEFRVAFAFAPPEAPHAHLADIERIRNIAQLLVGGVENLPMPLREGRARFCQLVLTKPELRSFLGRVVDWLRPRSASVPYSRSIHQLWNGRHQIGGFRKPQC